MLALSTVNCSILKIINYCQLCNTQATLYTVILWLMCSCNFLRACTISKPFFTLMYNVLLPPMLCGCDLYIATPHCVHSLLNIANHNRLDNFSEPRNRESIKWDCTIVLQYIEFHLVPSRALSGRTIVRCSLFAYPPSALPSFLPSWSCSGSVIVLLFWRVCFSSCCFCKGLGLLRRLVGTFDTGNKRSRPIQQPL